MAICLKYNQKWKIKILKFQINRHTQNKFLTKISKFPKIMNCKNENRKIIQQNNNI